MKRTLVLRREPLTELNGAELLAVAGGVAPTQPLRDCLAATTPATLLAGCPGPSDAHTCVDCLTRWC